MTSMLPVLLVLLELAVLLAPVILPLLGLS